MLNGFCCLHGGRLSTAPDPTPYSATYTSRHRATTVGTSPESPYLPMFHIVSNSLLHFVTITVAHLIKTLPVPPCYCLIQPFPYMLYITVKHYIDYRPLQQKPRKALFFNSFSAFFSFSAIHSFARVIHTFASPERLFSFCGQNTEFRMLNTEFRK